MTAPDHLKITGPEDVLGFIPHSLGYWPEHSLVAMTMQGKRLGATLRVDLPEDGSPGGIAAFANAVAGYLAADDKADGVLLAFFLSSDAAVTGGTGAASGGTGAASGGTGAASGGTGAASGGTGAASGGTGAAWTGLLAELEHALAGGGMPVRDAWLIGAERWRNAYCTDPACCPPLGRPIEEIRNSKLNAEMVFRGSSVGPAPGADAPGTVPQPEDPEALESERTWFRLLSGHTRNRPQFCQILDVWAVILRSDGARLPAGLAGYLRASLRVPAWRDAVLVMAAAGPEAAEQGAAAFGMFDRSGPQVPRAPNPLPPLDGFGQIPPRSGVANGAGGGAEGGPEVPGYGEVLLGLSPSVPDWARMNSLDGILAQLGGASGEAGAAALTGRGWIEWCRGKGSVAHALFSRADEVLPGYRLAALLAELVSRGTLCGWAARREAAWQRFEPGAA